MGPYRIRTLALLAFCFPSLIPCPAKQPSLEKLKEQVEEGAALLIDVRTTQEWVNGHVTFALHIPLDELEEGRFPKGLPQDKILYLHCERGRRSALAVDIFKKNGYDCVVNVTYNIAAFQQAGYPITQ